MNLSKNYSKIILTLLFGYFLLLNFFQLSQQHWSSILDQDIIIIYNSLLVSSGYEQEYRGHPGYTTFFIIGIFFKFFSIFYDNFSVQEILVSNNIDADLQNLFIIARVINSFFNFFLILFLYKILKKLNLKENICIISVLLLVFYSSFYESLFLLRSELLSVLIVLISFYCLLEFIENKKKLMPILFSGFFSCLAVLAKMQAIFLIVVILFCLPFLFNYYEKNNNILRKKYYYLINYFFLIFVLLAYVIFQLALQFDPRFIFSKNVDIFALFFLILSYGFFLIILHKKKITNYREIISSISLFIFGFLFCLVFVKFIDLIGIIKISNEVILRLTNPIYYMSVFTNINTDSNIFVTIKDTLYLILNFSQITTFVIINILLIIASLLFNFIKKNDHLMLCLILFLGIVSINFILNLRVTRFYSIYYIPFTIILISIIINNFSRSALMLIYFILFLNFTAELVINRNHEVTSIIRSFNLPDNIKKICNNDRANTQSYVLPVEYFNYWTTQFNEKFIEKYCEQNKHKT